MQDRAVELFVQALRRDSPEWLGQALRAGLDMNVLDAGSGENVVMVAALSGKARLLAAMLAAGGDSRARSRHGSSVLSYAVSGNSLAAVERLLHYGSGCDPGAFALAARRCGGRAGGDMRIFLRLLHEVEESQAVARNAAGLDRYGDALIEAADNDGIAVMGLLLAAGFDVNHRNADGDTALRAAIRGRHRALEAFLRAHGAE